MNESWRVEAPDPWKILRAVAVTAALLLLVLVIADACSPKAHADPGDVTVTDNVAGAYQLQQQLNARLTNGDEIAVLVVPGSEHDLLGSYLTNESEGKILLLVIGEHVWVRGNRWVPTPMLEDKLDRIDNVTRRPVDQVIKLIDQIHAYQDATPSPAPPPPPPPPGIGEAVPNDGSVPPAVPAGPSWIDSVPWWAWIVPVPVAGLIIILIVQKIRRDKNRRILSDRADQQADWGYDDYGIKSTID